MAPSFLGEKGSDAQRAGAGRRAAAPRVRDRRRAALARVLGVPLDMCSIEEVRAAFRRRAMELRPDRPGGSHDAMTELNAALAAVEQELSQ